MNDWQTWAALAVVLFVALIFAAKLGGRKKAGGGCGHNCGCDHPKKLP